MQRIYIYMLFCGQLVFFSKGCYGAVSSKEIVQCKDEAGRGIDWFIVYKLPRVHDHKNRLVRAGVAYSYITPKSKTLGWQLSTHGINESSSIVGITLEPLFNSTWRNKLAYVTYNDQPPDSRSKAGNGHTKGTILSTIAGDLWIQHSVPHFPNLTQSHGSWPTYQYPETGFSYGQLFSCINFENVDWIGKMFRITQPNIVNWSIPTQQLENKLTNVFSFVKKDHGLGRKPHTKNKGAWKMFMKYLKYSYDQLKYFATLSWRKRPSVDEKEEPNIFEEHSVENRSLKIFAKSPKWKIEIYSEWIALNLEKTLEVQSWLNGPHAYSSNCSKLTDFRVYNVKDTIITKVEFTTHEDHSKWAAVSLKNWEGADVPENPWLCISDLNRMEHQKNRGGGAVCFEDGDVWKAFTTSVVDLQPCSNTKYSSYQNNL